MKYGLLLWPHANARYQAESARLARGELQMMLEHLCPEAASGIRERHALNMLEFETSEPLDARAIRALSRHSLLYMLFAWEGELLRPISGRAPADLGEDLPGILKYKGKTNENFTAMLMNAALYASDFRDRAEERLKFLDPMCSRGTSLFLAVNRGWDADGGDISRMDLRELTQFFKRYLEYHKFKHAKAQKSLTLKGGQGQKSAPLTEFTFAADPAAYRAGDVRTLRTVECDCGSIAAALGKNRYHILACDLPYGVQHSPGSERFEALLARALPAWRDALVPGGAMALSYNTNTLKPDALRALMAQSGLEVADTQAYGGFSHWVEQAVTRDIAIGVKRGPKK